MQSKAFDKKKKLEIKSRKLEIDEHFLNLLRSIYKEIKNTGTNILFKVKFWKFYFWTGEKEKEFYYEHFLSAFYWMSAGAILR